MTNKRKYALLSEILDTEMSGIEYELQEIESSHHSAQKSLLEQRAALEKKNNASEYDWDDIAYGEGMLYKIKRVRYACIAVQLSAITEDFLFGLCANTGLIKIILPNPKTKPNQREIKDCVDKEIKEEHLNWGTYKQLIEKYKKIEFSNLSNFDDVERFRKLSNCFKHSMGRINASFAKRFGGDIGDEIRYESEKWKQLFSGCKNFLKKLAGELLL